MGLDQLGQWVRGRREIEDEEGHRRWVPLYMGLAAALGLGVLWLGLTRLSAVWGELLPLVLMAVLVEALGTELRLGPRGNRIPLPPLIAMASISLFGPLAGLPIYAAAGLLRAFAASRRGGRGGWVPTLWQVAFHVGMWAIATAMAGWIYLMAGGQVGGGTRLTDLLPLALTAWADVLVNIAILIGALALETGQHPAHLWQTRFWWRAPISILGATLGGALLAWAYGVSGMLGMSACLLGVMGGIWSHVAPPTGQVEGRDER